MTDELSDLCRRERFRHWYANPLRYNDTDRQGHVNNVAYATFCEQGRSDFLASVLASLQGNCSVVLARLTIDFRREAFWPGTVDIGTAVLSLGRSSVTLAQGMFLADACLATATSVVVLVDNATRRSTPWPDAARTVLSA